MVTKKQRSQMLDYLADKLAGCGEVIVPRTKQIISGIDSSYIKVGNDGIVLLVDRVYPNNILGELYEKVRKQRENICIVFYKDGKTFFRSAAEKNYYKIRNGLSLKNYSDDTLYKIILFRPEESFVYTNIGKLLQYYQPGSNKLDEVLVNFEFKPVYYDYSHIDPKSRFRPTDTYSRKLHIWVNKEFCKGKLKLESNMLKCLTKEF